MEMMQPYEEGTTPSVSSATTSWHQQLKASNLRAWADIQQNTKGNRWERLCSAEEDASARAAKLALWRFICNADPINFPAATAAG